MTNTKLTNRALALRGGRTTMTARTPQKEAERALNCLYIAVDETVAKDVSLKVQAWVDAERAVSRVLAEALGRLGYHNTDCSRKFLDEAQDCTCGLDAALAQYNATRTPPDTPQQRTPE